MKSIFEGNIFEGVTATGGLAGVNAGPAECVTSRNDNPGEQLLADWDEFWSGLSVEEVDSLATGTASAELEFDLLMLTNSQIPDSYFDQYR